MNLDKAVVIDKYVNQGVGIKRIAKCYGATYTKIRWLLVSSGVRLRHKHTFRSLIGDRYGDLEVVELISRNTRNGHKSTFWKCLCRRCGSHVRYNGIAVKRAKCCKQCRWEEKYYGGVTRYKEITASFFYGLMSDAEERGLEFRITQEYIWGLFEAQNRKCALTGIDLVFSAFNADQRSGRTASLDRINNKFGYVEGNVRWVHKNINMMKGRLNDESLLFWSKAIVQYANKEK